MPTQIGLNLILQLCCSCILLRRVLEIFSPVSKQPALTKTYDANVIPLILQGVMEALLSSLAHCEMMAVAIS